MRVFKLERYNYILTGFASNILGNFLMFLTTIFLTRSYSTAVYGEFRLLFSFVSIAVIISLFGRDNGIIYYAQHEEKTKQNNVIIQETTFGFINLIIGSLILYFLGDYVISLLFNTAIVRSHYNIAIVMIPLWGLFNLLLAGVKSKGYINFSFILSNLTQRALRLPFFIGLTLISAQFFSLAYSMILSQLVLIGIAIKKIPFVMNCFSVKLTDFFKRAGYAFQLGINTIIVVLLTKIDVIMVGKLMTNSSVAIYDIAVLLAFVVMMPFIALVKSSEPTMNKLIKDQSVYNLYKKNLQLAFNLATVVFLGYILFSDLILTFFGPSYVAGQTTLLVLSLGFLAVICLGAPIEILNMNGYSKFSTYILLSSVGVNVGLNIWLIPLYQQVGAAIATITSLLLTKGIALIIIKQQSTFNMYLKNISIKLVLLFVGACSITSLININNWVYNKLLALSIFILYSGYLIITYKQSR